MKVSILNALKRCTDNKSSFEALGKIFYYDGALYATDSYVLVRVFFNHEGIEDSPLMLDWEALEDKKPSDIVNIAEYLKEPNCLVPKLPKLFEEGAKVDKKLTYCTDPKLLKKVLGVFEAAKVDIFAGDMIPYFGLYGFKTGASPEDDLRIEAIVMMKRSV